MLASSCSPGSQGQEDRAGAFSSVSISSASPPQGELNGQRGLVPSNFLEGPGPEAGGLESGTSQAESQVSGERAYQLSISPTLLVFWNWDVTGGWGGSLRGQVHNTKEHCMSQQSRVLLGHPHLVYAPLGRSVMAETLIPRPSDSTDANQGSMQGRDPMGKDPATSQSLGCSHPASSSWLQDNF